MDRHRLAKLMALVTSGAAGRARKESLMPPAVVNETADTPAKLEKVEIPPGSGNFFKMSAADAKAAQDRAAADAANPAAYQTLVTGSLAAPSGPAEVGLTVLSKAELVALAEARGLSTSGTKAEIAARFGAAPAEVESPEMAGGDTGAEAGAPAGVAPDATTSAE